MLISETTSQALRLARGLLGAGHDHGGGDPTEEESHAEELDSHFDEGEHHSDDDTLDLRIIAIFVILVAGLLGAIPPTYLEAFKDAASTPSRILRAFAGGVIIALALVHIIPHGSHDMDELPTNFSYAGPTVLFGVIFMVLLENAAQAYLASTKGAHVHCHSSHSLKSQADDHEHDHESEAGEKPIKSDKEHAHIQVHTRAHDPEIGAVPVVASAGDGHTHSCLRTNHSANLVLSASAAEKTSGSLRQQVAAYMFELGCVTHSFIIGLTLGVIVEDRNTVIALLIALAFHQLLEGISLGSMIALAGFSKKKALFMIVGYSMTTPVGVAVGIAISDSYDHSSVTALAVQGTLSCVAGGMLLYISLVQLIAEDFSREDANKPVTMTVRVLSYFALIFGCFTMCLLANWA